MVLTPDVIADTALAILADFGLGDLTMRRVARELEVQPSALYWHVADKQSLFVLLAERIAAEAAHRTDTNDPIQLLQDYRRVLLRYRESADIVLLAHAHSGARALPPVFSDMQEAERETMAAFVLGSVALQQNRILFDTADGTQTSDPESSYTQGVTRLLTS